MTTGPQPIIAGDEPSGPLPQPRRFPQIEDRDDLPKGVTAVGSADGSMIMVRASLPEAARRLAVRRLLATARHISGLARVAVLTRARKDRP